MKDPSTKGLVMFQRHRARRLVSLDQLQNHRTESLQVLFKSTEPSVSLQYNFLRLNNFLQPLHVLFLHIKV